MASVVPARSARRPAAWMDGPSAMGSVKGMPTSMTSAPACGKALEDRERSREVRVAGHHEGDEGGAAVGAKGVETVVDAGGHSRSGLSGSAFIRLFERWLSL